MLRKHPRPGPIGLDLGATSVKLLQLVDEGGQPAVQAAARCALPADVEDPSARAALVQRAVQEALRTQPFRGRDVVTALGSGEFQTKSVRLPRMPAEELASAVEFEALERFDLGGRPAQLRFLPAGEVRHGTELKEELLVFAALDETVAARIALLDSLKLRPAAVEIAPCALARGFIRFLRRAEDVNAVNVFVDVGWRAAHIVVTHGTKIAFLKLVDVGGLHFTRAVADGLGLSLEQALDLRIRLMRDAAGRRAADRSPVSAEIAAAAADAVRPHVEQLHKDLQLCLRYFAVTFRGRRPESLTFVGGEAHEPALLRILGDGSDIPCMIGHPLRGMGNLDRLEDQDRRFFQPAWAIACGLALRGTAWVPGAGSPSRFMTDRRAPAATDMPALRDSA